MLALVDGDRLPDHRLRRSRGAPGHGTQSIQHSGAAREWSHRSGGPALVSLTPRDGGALLRSTWPPLSHRRSQSLLFLALTERKAIFWPCTSVLELKAAGNRPSCEVVLDHQSPGLLPGLSPPGGPHAAGVSGTVCACATSPREGRVSPPGVRPTCVSLSHVVHCAWHKTRALSPTMLCYTHACKFKLPLGPVAGGFCVRMIFPPCPHALHGREPSCIMRWNVHICSLYEAGHSRGARGQPPDTGAPL